MELLTTIILSIIFIVVCISAYIDHKKYKREINGTRKTKKIRPWI